MSFLKPLAQSGMFGLGGMLAGGAGGHHEDSASGAATGLGHLLNTDPSRIAGIADRIGTGANMIAAGGGAPAAYQAPQAMHPTGAPAGGGGADFGNVMQYLTPESLQHIQSMFGGYSR